MATQSLSAPATAAGLVGPDDDSLEAEIARVAAAMGGNVAAATTYCNAPGLVRHLQRGWIENDLKRIPNRLDALRKARVAADRVRTCMMDEPFRDERHDYCTVWNDLIARADIDIARDEAEMSDLLNLSKEYGVPIPASLTKSRPGAA